MTERVLGPTGSRRRSRTLLVPIFLIALIGLFVIAGAQAVNQTGAFELDGNAVSANAPTPVGPADDWDRVCHQVTAGGTDSAGHATGAQCASATNTNGATAVSWTDARVNEEIYTGGGSKDFNDPQADWLWKPKDTVPDKDTITHSFAARYSLPKSATCPAPAAATTCEVIFFGSDRFANDGDSQLGFWFFQNKIQTTNTASQGGFKFSGQHQTGDILVISNFSNGGTTSTIKIYSWDPAACPKADNGNENNIPVGGCPAANLKLESKAQANCATSPATANSCGIVNASNGTPAPWPFLDKTGNTNFQQGELFEAGLNLSGLGFGNECFASVLAESRSSDSTTAVLKDFVLSNFGECTSGIVTTPQTFDGTNGTDITADVSIGSAARVSVRDKAVITVTGGASTFNGSVKFFICGPLALASTTNCATGGVQIGLPLTGESVSGSGGTATVYSDPATLTSVGRYCWRGEYSGDPSKTVPGSSDPKPTGDTTTTECFKVVPITPVLTTSAGADVTLGSSITDTASLTGTAKQPGTDGIGPGGTINATAGTQAAAGGSITFTVKGPNNCNASGLTVTGSPVTVSGDNASYGPVSATPTAVGTYTFVAEYINPTTNTNAAGPSSCPPAATDGDEVVVVSGQASLATDQKWLPNDRAHVTGPSGTTLAGTVTFTLYNGSTCGVGATGGTAQYGPIAKNVVTDADASPAPTANDRYVSTSNSTFFVTVANDATAWSWKVSYDDTNLNDPADKCESTTPAFTLSD
jgi:hypothetical protein